MRCLSDQEVLSLLSKVRLGIDLGIIEDVKAQVFNDLLVVSQTNYLQNLQENENMSQNEIDKKRAALIRAAFAKSTAEE